MAYEKRNILDRIATGDDIFEIQEMGSGKVKLIPSPDEVVEEGSNLNKQLLQPMEDVTSKTLIPIGDILDITTTQVIPVPQGAKKMKAYIMGAGGGGRYKIINPSHYPRYIEGSGGSAGFAYVVEVPIQETDEVSVVIGAGGNGQKPSGNTTQTDGGNTELYINGELVGFAEGGSSRNSFGSACGEIGTYPDNKNGARGGIYCDGFHPSAGRVATSVLTYCPFRGSSVSFGGAGAGFQQGYGSVRPEIIGVGGFPYGGAPGQDGQFGAGGGGGYGSNYNHPNPAGNGGDGVAVIQFYT